MPETINERLARARANRKSYAQRLPAYSQALLLQDKIAEVIKQNGIAPSALAALSEQWVKLENYKQSVRPKAPKVRSVAKAVSSTREPSPGQSAMREPDEPPANEEKA